MWQTLAVVTLVCCFKTSENIQWPAGTYGIPKPVAGCPAAEGFQWKEGWRSQDTDGTKSNNERSEDFHLDGAVDGIKINRSFCVKMDTTSDINRPLWPPGQYCVYKFNQCPAGLTQGFVKWDDDDGDAKFNDKGGTLPNGTYDHNTEIKFCCRTDGDKIHPILLPTKTPFFLLAYNSTKCQMVSWATVSQEWIHYDTENTDNLDNATGAYPFEADKKHPTIYYCFYQGCNETLFGVSGTFQSPNYPKRYPDGQHCSWRITVSPAEQIHLTFTNFSLQNESNTDGLYVYDAENATGEALGVFYGGHPPPREGLNSSSNHMFVIFKSDRSGSYSGFKATYYSRSALVPSTSTSSTPSLEVTSPTRTQGPSDDSLQNSRATQEIRQSNSKAMIYGPIIGILMASLVVLMIYTIWRVRKRQWSYQLDEAPVENLSPHTSEAGGTPPVADVPTHTGVFCCEIPDKTSVRKKVICNGTFEDVPQRTSNPP